MRLFVFTLGVMCPAAGTGVAAAERIEVMVCNLAEVPQRTVAAAKDETGYLFGSAGVLVEWVECGQAVPARDGVRKARFVVRLRRQPAGTRPVSGGAERMGRAFVPVHQPAISAEASRYADVYYDVTSRLARSHPGVDEGQVLGAAVAHELGHLFLGETHTEGTIMSAAWGSPQLEAVRKRALRFDKKDRGLMVGDLRRLRKEEALLAAGKKKPAP